MQNIAHTVTAMQIEKVHLLSLERDDLTAEELLSLLAFSPKKSVEECKAIIDCFLHRKNDLEYKKEHYILLFHVIDQFLQKTNPADSKTFAVEIGQKLIIKINEISKNPTDFLSFYSAVLFYLYPTENEAFSTFISVLSYHHEYKENLSYFAQVLPNEQQFHFSSAEKERIFYLTWIRCSLILVQTDLRMPKEKNSLQVRDDSPCWTILGITSNASIREISAAYKEKARILHPDKGGDTEQFQQLAEAYAQALEYAQEKA